MTVFISYNHKDVEFVERLCLELIRQDIKVWKDSWRIGVGDSLIQKVQDGIEGAHFFCIVFSRNSVRSEWMTREITAALLREIEDRKVMILPILLDDIKLPIFIRDKLYADFRSDFEEGLDKLLAVLVPYYGSKSLGRASPRDRYYIDYAYDTKIVDARIVCEFDIVSFDLDEPYSVLTRIRFEGSADASLDKLGVKSVEQISDLILNTCVDEFSKNPGHISLSPGSSYSAHFTIQSEDGLRLFDAYSTAKILGKKHKGAVLYNLGALFSQIELSGSS